jgi:hypothetical protein
MNNSTPRSRPLFEKLQGPQLVKNDPTFYGTRRFITAFKRAHHLPYEADQSSTCTHPASRTPVSILSSHLSLDLPSKLFPSGLPNETPHAPLLFPITCYMPSHVIILDLITRIIFYDEYGS